MQYNMIYYIYNMIRTTSPASSCGLIKGLDLYYIPIFCPEYLSTRCCFGIQILTHFPLT